MGDESAGLVEEVREREGVEIKSADLVEGVCVREGVREKQRDTQRCSGHAASSGVYIYVHMRKSRKVKKWKVTYVYRCIHTQYA